MSDNDDYYVNNNNNKNDLDGLKVFIKAKHCFPLDEGEQKLFDSYDEEEKKMIYDFLDDASCRVEIENLEQEIKDEEIKKQSKKMK